MKKEVRKKVLALIDLDKAGGSGGTFGSGDDVKTA